MTPRSKRSSVISIEIAGLLNIESPGDFYCSNTSIYTDYLAGLHTAPHSVYQYAISQQVFADAMVDRRTINSYSSFTERNGKSGVFMRSRSMRAAILPIS